MTARLHLIVNRSPRWIRHRGNTPTRRRTTSARPDGGFSNVICHGRTRPRRDFTAFQNYSWEYAATGVAAGRIPPWSAL